MTTALATATVEVMSTPSDILVSMIDDMVVMLPNEPDANLLRFDLGITRLKYLDSVQARDVFGGKTVVDSYFVSVWSLLATYAMDDEKRPWKDAVLDRYRKGVWLLDGELLEG